MLKIVYRVCCGMDVHKSFVVACIASTNEYGVTTYKSKRFSTFTGDLRRCAEWLFENNCKDVCMESTGKYWIPIYNNPGQNAGRGKAAAGQTAVFRWLRAVWQGPEPISELPHGWQNLFSVSYSLL